MENVSGSKNLDLDSAFIKLLVQGIQEHLRGSCQDQSNSILAKDSSRDIAKNVQATVSTPTAISEVSAVENKQRNTKPTVVEFCSGIGGNRLAFQDFFKVVGACEILEESIRVYKENFGDEKGHQLGDLTKLKPDQIPHADGYMISSPCQSFSHAGKRKGLKDERGQVLFSFFNLVEANKPKFFFIENVPGMETVNKGRDFKAILARIKSLGYTVHHQVLISSDFGVPQMRKRLYIVAFLNNVKFDFPKPWIAKPKSKDVLEGKVSEHYFLSQDLIDKKVARRKAQKAKGNAFGFRTLNADGAARTLLKSAGSKDKNLVMVAYRKNAPTTRGVFSYENPKTGKIQKCFLRHLTPREYARLQGFKDDFRLVASETNTYEQLGNSVSVPVLREIAKEIFLSFTLNLQLEAPVKVKAIVNPTPRAKLSKKVPKPKAKSSASKKQKKPHRTSKKRPSPSKKETADQLDGGNFG